MGYYSSLEGSFEITPPPPAGTFNKKKLQEDQDRNVEWGLECIIFEFDRVSSTEIEEDGTEITRSRTLSAHLKACHAGGHKHYYIQETLQAIVDMLGRQRTYKGYFHENGEDGAQWRWGIENGVVKRYEPEILWPKAVSDG